MDKTFRGWAQWQLDIAASLYPDNPELQLEVIRRRTEANRVEHEALVKQAEEIRNGRQSN